MSRLERVMNVEIRKRLQIEKNFRRSRVEYIGVVWSYKNNGGTIDEEKSIGNHTRREREDNHQVG